LSSNKTVKHNDETVDEIVQPMEKMHIDQQKAFNNIQSKTDDVILRDLKIPSVSFCGFIDKHNK